MTISSAGIGSGLDVTSLVNQLMTVESRPLELLKTRGTTVQNQISAFGRVKSQLDALRAAAVDLGKPATWTVRSATLSDAKVATASAAATATAGDYAIEVTQLAAAHRLASAARADATTAIGTGTLTLETGSWSGAAFTAKAGTSPVTITLTGANNTLAGVRDAINTANAGVRASVVTDATGSRLVLTSTATGAGSQIRVTADDDDGTDTDGAGLSALAYAGDTSATAPGLRQVQAGADARVKVDGLEVTSATNAITAAIDGVTLNVLTTNAGSPATLTVKEDKAAVRAQVDRFVAAYNAAATLLADFTKADPTGKANGTLVGDASARNVAATLRSLTTRMLPSGTLRSLSQAGIAIGKTGTLSVDETRFAAAVASGAGNLAALFSAAGDGTADSRGIAVRLGEALTTALGAEGMIASRATGLEATLKSNQKAQDAQEARLARVRERMMAQYTALDLSLSKLSTMSSGLTQALDALPGFTTKNN